MDRFACSMCCYKGASHSLLLTHIVRNHQNNPLFQVKCNYEGCGATYRQWKSFRSHIYKKHGVDAQLNAVAERLGVEERFILNNNQEINEDEGKRSKDIS